MILSRLKISLRYIRLLCLWVLICGVITPAATLELVEFDREEQTNRYNALIDELRCLVCQNQSLADSNADLAKDMRAVVIDMIRNNHDDEVIIRFMTERYGDFVRYRPLLDSRTALLWFMPFILILLIFIWLPAFIRSHRAVPLSAAERQQAARLLQE